jgi:predicted nucleic acid-binding protein
MRSTNRPSGDSIRTRTVAFLAGLRANPLVTLVPATSLLIEEGWSLYCQRPDKDWGLTDCTSFAVMTARGVRQAFTSDRHFIQAGFTVLL